MSHESRVLRSLCACLARRSANRDPRIIKFFIRHTVSDRRICSAAVVRDLSGNRGILSLFRAQKSRRRCGLQTTSR